MGLLPVPIQGVDSGKDAERSIHSLYKFSFTSHIPQGEGESCFVDSVSGCLPGGGKIKWTLTYLLSMVLKGKSEH